MPGLSRRDVIRNAAAVIGATAAATPATAALAGTAGTAGAAGPSRRHGDISDIKHVVVLMQENRSFDHYFGSLRGVRGFGDRSTITLPGGYPVWQQPTTPPGQPVTGTQYPWRLASGTFSGAQPPSPEVGAQNYVGTDHSWESQHGAWNGGCMNAWYYAKDGPITLGFLNRDDIPYHYALADAYTIGDAYHCSVLSATGPNRTYLWSGTVNADQEHGSFVAFSGGDELGRFLSWESYPETLQAAGVSWKVYQGSDNYGDNGAEYFATFAKFDPEQGGTPAPGVIWYDNGVAAVPEPYPAESRNCDNLALAIRKDVLAGTLPQVSWVVTNQLYSEHPDGAPHDGAYYINEVLKALNADPDVFNSTLVIVAFDENDGQFVAPGLNAADYPARFPGQYTVGPSRASWGNTVAGSVGIGTGWYDLTIVGPNRFLRHFTGDLGAPGLTAQAQAAYSPHGFAGEPRLWLTLTNNGTEPVTFTVTPDHYSSEPVRTYRVPAHGSAMHVADPLADGHGWYDLSVAISSDRSWARRFVGHLEDGNASVTG